MAQKSFTVITISQILAYVNCSCLLILFMGIILTYLKKLHSKIRYNYVSSKPGLSILWYCGLADFLIFVSTNFWFVKACLLYQLAGSDRKKSFVIFFICWAVCYAFASLLEVRSFTQVLPSPGGGIGRRDGLKHHWG